MDMLLIPYEDAEGIVHSRQVVESVKGKKSLGIYIGPEGGFPEEEVSLAMEARCRTDYTWPSDFAY